MLNKTNTATSQIVTASAKTSSIPHDFEPVSRQKQDEEKDSMYFHAGDKENSKFAMERYDDDEADENKETDDVAIEEVLHEDDEKSIDD